MTREATPGLYVFFYWQGEAMAVPAEAVARIVDAPNWAPLPVPYGTARRMVASGGALCPLLEPPEAPEELQRDEAILVLTGKDGDVAVRARGPIRILPGEAEGGWVRAPQRAPARLERRASFLARLERRS